MTALLLCLSFGLVVLFLLRRVGRSTSQVVECGLEQLETRIAPAALTAKFSAGVLSIAGDPAAATVDILETAGSIEVFDGTTSLGTFSNVKSIKANIQGGAAIVANLADGGIDGSLNVSVTEQSSLVVSAGSRIAGAFSFKGDASTQTLTVGNNAVIGKAFSYNAASGNDTFTIGEGTNIGGTVTFTAVEDGTFTTAPSAITISGGLRFKNASTSVPVNIESLGAAGLNVSGTVSYAGGTGDDNLFVGGIFSRSAAYFDASGDNRFGIAFTSTVHGSIKMVTGGGNDGFNIQGGTIDGDISLKLGSGNNSFYYGIGGAVTIGGNLSMTTGAGNDLWQSSGGGMTLNGNLTMKLSDGTNTIASGVTMTGNKILVTTGSGVDSVSLDGSATNAAIKMILGAGTDTLAGTLLRNASSATFDGGDGIDHFVENMLTTDPLIIIGFEDFS
jgi:hypothetical protein